MPEVDYTYCYTFGNEQNIKWVLGDGDTGRPWRRANYQDKYLQINGTFGSATVILEGTNDINLDGTVSSTAVWTTLKYVFDGSAISETSADGGQVLCNPAYIRPSSSGGTGSAINVTLTAVKGY
jgi:hypothetical protein